MIKEILTIVISLIVLFSSANFFIDGAVALARRLGMSTLLVGVVIIGFGTSAPEIIVSTLASLDGSSGIALGNAYGSNILNIGIILGLAAIINPISVPRNVLFIEMPILLLTSALSFYFMQNGYLSRVESSIFLLIFVIYMSYTLIRSKSSNRPITPSTTQINMVLWKTLLLLIGGLTALIISAKGFVWGASELARQLNVSDVIIGLTIVSLGTSLPELSATLVAAIKHQHDMALGNIIGSNIFNTLVVVGIAGLIQPIHNIDIRIITRDIPTMSAFSLLLLFFSLSRKREHRINRLEGATFLFGYAFYLLILFKTL